jgi:hypothetical protein
VTDKQQQIEDLLGRVVALPAEQWARFLDANCHDEAIRREVERLLESRPLEGGEVTEDFDGRHVPATDASPDSPDRGHLPRPTPATPSGSSIDHGRFLPGTVLAERYRIVGLLGKGGMGEVYRADDLGLGVSVALKFLPKRLADDPRSLERFRGEVRLARQVSHPNVSRVYDIGQIDGHWFLSMEYVVTAAAEKLLEAGREGGWTMVSMKDDWSRIFND